MLSKKLKYQTQSILVPRKNYKNVVEAANHVEQLGFKSDVKTPHISDRFYRFRQREPDKKHSNYKTLDMPQGDKKIVMAFPKDSKMLLGQDESTYTPKYLQKQGNPYSIPLKKK